MLELFKRRVLDGYKTCDEIDKSRSSGFRTPVQQEKRKLIKIAVIDDQPFEAVINLRNYGYNISEKGDVKRLDEVQEYPIVLCDLMNVGLFFDRDAQGASLIKEIKRNYPSKFIAAYSGSSSNSPQAQRAQQYADIFIKKDLEIESWVEKLDDLIASATDPRLVWLRTRSAMISEQVDTRTILILEDAYVRSISEKGDLSFVRSIMNQEDFGGAVKNIMYGLASSAIFAGLS